MKKLTTCLLLLLIVSTSFGQQINPKPSLTKQDYMRKGKHQQIAALSLLGGGIVLGSIGSVTTAKETLPHIVFPVPVPIDEQKVNNGVGLMTVGLVAALTSIPFFIASSKNKKKAMSMSFNNQSLPLMHGNNVVYHAIPSLKLKISL